MGRSALFSLFCSFVNQFGPFLKHALFRLECDVKGSYRTGLFKNAEGYSDPTPGTAWRNICRETDPQDAERRTEVNALISLIKGAADLAGFKIVGRIVFKDKNTGKEYR